MTVILGTKGGYLSVLTANPGIRNAPLQVVLQLEYGMLSSPYNSNAHIILHTKRHTGAMYLL